MTDNYTPGNQNLDSYVGEKPHCVSDEASAPILQNVQTNYYPNQNNYPNNQTVSPGYNDNTQHYEQSYYMNKFNTNAKKY